MISKIIQKEKEEQTNIQKGCGLEGDGDLRDIGEDCGKDNMLCIYCSGKADQNKKDLINLKEYMEEEELFIQAVWESLDTMKTGVTGCDAKPTWRGVYNRVEKRVKQLKEDIEELTKMIEAYK